jgi:hypothetical protein
LTGPPKEHTDESGFLLTLVHIGITLAIHFVLRFMQKRDRWTEKHTVDDRYYIKICASTRGSGRINVEVALVATRAYVGITI